MDSYKVNFAKMMGPKFYSKDPFLEHCSEKSGRKKLLEEMGIINDDYILNLSNRHLECIDYFLEGKTAKEIGKKLHLSHRTVEGYIEDIKLQFGCNRRSELFEILQMYKAYNIL